MKQIYENHLSESLHLVGQTVWDCPVQVFMHILHIYHNCQKPKFHDVSHGHGNSGVARVDQLPGHQVAFYKLNMKICRRDI